MDLFIKQYQKKNSWHVKTNCILHETHYSVYMHPYNAPIIYICHLPGSCTWHSWPSSLTAMPSSTSQRGNCCASSAPIKKIIGWMMINILFQIIIVRIIIIYIYILYMFELLSGICKKNQKRISKKNDTFLFPAQCFLAKHQMVRGAGTNLVEAQGQILLHFGTQIDGIGSH